MDWARAIERNSQALKAIVAALFAMLGSATGPRIARELHRAVLRVLRPAESAVRRLIVIAARDLVLKPTPSRPCPKGLKIPRKCEDAMAFQLFDPRLRFAAWRPRRIPDHKAPRIWTIGHDPTVAALWAYQRSLVAAPARPPDDGLIDGRRLSLRLEALKAALADLPRQARRLVRWQARREALQKPHPTFTLPLRPGRPPGYRKKPLHEVDHILAECHALAWDGIEPDTS
jgi:hypothetical protein